MAYNYLVVKTKSENTAAFLPEKTRYREIRALHYESYSEQFFYHAQRLHGSCYVTRRVTRAGDSEKE